MKEYCKVQALWKMVGEDGIEEALKKRAEAGGFSQCGPADAVMDWYKELLKWNKEWEETTNILHPEGEGGGSSSSGSIKDWWKERQESAKEELKEEALKEEKSVP